MPPEKAEVTLTARMVIGQGMLVVVVVGSWGCWDAPSSGLQSCALCKRVSSFSGFLLKGKSERPKQLRLLQKGTKQRFWMTRFRARYDRMIFAAETLTFLLVVSSGTASVSTLLLSQKMMRNYHDHHFHVKKGCTNKPFAWSAALGLFRMNLHSGSLSCCLPRPWFFVSFPWGSPVEHAAR